MSLKYPYATAFAAILAIVLRYVYPNHESNPLVQLQSTVQAALRPAQWIPYIRNLHRYEMEIGKYKLSHFTKSNDEKEIIENMILIISKSNLIPTKTMKSNDGYIMEANYYTPGTAWLDVVTLKIIINKSNDTIFINGIGESTGLFPLTVPLAPFLNIITCWFPFDDWGNNKTYLKTIKSNINSNL